MDIHMFLLFCRTKITVVLVNVKGYPKATIFIFIPRIVATAIGAVGQRGSFANI